MQLSDEEVKKIARLARLGLSDDEIKKFGGHLSEILTYVKKLEEVDTSNVEPIAQITGLTNVSFEDKVDAFGRTDELLKQTPMQVQDHMIKVKNVF